MTNHAHLVLYPRDANGLSLALGAAHKRWAKFINGRARRRRHLFDGRFASVAMDERHLIGAIRDAALNPVRARCDACGNGKWSSVHSHPARKDDGLVTVAPVLRRIADFTAFIAEQADDTGFAALRRAEQAGRPVDTADFIKVASAFSSGGLRGGTRPQAGGNDRGAGAAVIDSR